MTDLQQAPTIDVDKLMAFVFKAVDEVGATLNTALVVLGDKLGYYTTMAGGPVTPAQLAASTGTGEPYAREWLNAQAAGGYVEYDATAGRYTLPPEQTAALVKLVKEYLFSRRPDIATEQWEKIQKAGLGSLYFAWSGEITPGKPHYYRVQGGNFVLEYDNTQNGANHVHSMWRDFDHDFGMDLLKAHLDAAHAPAAK